MSVSVIIPAYNSEAFIGKALASVFGQTVPVDEVIVVDDGSTDGTCAAVEGCGRPVRILRQRNQGPSAARNLAVEAAASDLVAFLDADDAWHPEKIEKQIAAMGRAGEDTVLCYTGLMNMHMDGSQTVQPVSPVETLGSTLRVRNPRIPPSCVMVRRDVFLRAGGFNLDLRGSEDWELLLRLLPLGRFAVVAEPLTLYQVSNTGLSSNADHQLREVDRMLEPHLLKGLRGWKRWLWRRRILSYQMYKAALTARDSSEHRKELRFLLRSFALWPSPFWHPYRFKVLAVTLRNALR